MLSFRPAVMADVAQIVALVNSAYRGESSRAGWTTEADLLAGQRTDADEVHSLIATDDSIILLCLQVNAIIGTVHLQHGHHAACMGMLVIKPGLQGQGLGKKLMQAAEATAIKMWGVDKMLMYVITLRPELIAFYERRGYHRSGKFKAFPQAARFGVPKVDGLQLEMLEKVL
jgi:ribosomal protein S18 acetylase RimI-like enzyme